MQNKIRAVLTPILLTIFFITGAVTFAVFFTPLYYACIDFLNIPDRANMSREDIILNFDALIRYYNPFSTAELSLPTLPMSVEGKIHFEDVKVLFNVMIYTFILSIPLSIWAIMKNRAQKSYAYLKHTAMLTIILPSVLGVLIALNWNRVFIVFHEIFFSNDYWVFDPRYDPIILMLPDTYFMLCALLVLGIILLCSLLCFIFSIKLNAKALQNV